MCNFRVAAMMLIAFATLGGCAKTPEIPFDHTAAPEIQKIGVITPQMPKDAAVILATSVGQHFGIIGALVDASLRSNRESKVKIILSDQGFVAADILAKSLNDRLTAEGYIVTAIPMTRGSADYIKVYPKADETNVDAYLDIVVVGYGYIAAGTGDSTPYRPAVAMRVRLVRARDSAVLMQDAVLYNPYNATTHEVTVAPDPDYVFVDFDTMTSDPQKMTAGLRIAIEQSMDATAKLLR
jgi:hypothetical protein